MVIPCFAGNDYTDKGWITQIKPFKPPGEICKIFFNRCNHRAQLFILLGALSLNPASASALKADDILSRMSLDEKIGQLFMPGIPEQFLTDKTAKNIREFHLGGVILSAGKNVKTRAQTVALTRELQKAALSSGANIPLLISIDQEGGVGSHINMLTGGVDTVGNLALGASGDPKDTYLSYKIMADDLKAYGINMALAPVLDLLLNKGNTMNHIRSFGEFPELASKLAPQAVKGFQENGIVACAKHFPGKGETEVDSHKFAPQNKSDLRFIREKILAPFRSAVKAGVDSIMTGHELYPALDPDHVSTISYKIITELLKKEMEFEGIVITDSITMGGVSEFHSSDEAAVLAIKAGADMILFAGDSPSAFQKAIQKIKMAIQDGSLSLERIDDAVKRILKVKLKYGLFDNKSATPKDVYAKQKKENYALSLKIARKTITLLKNDKNILPLPSDGSKKILVVTPKPFATVAMMDTVFPVGTSLGVAVTSVMPEAAVVEYDLSSLKTDVEKILKAADSADVIVFGSFHAYFSDEISELPKKLKSMEKPVVVVGLTVPYDIERFPQVDAFLAAYNPRSVSLVAAVEALFGKITPAGKPPVSVIEEGSCDFLNMGGQIFAPCPKPGETTGYEKEKAAVVDTMALVRNAFSNHLMISCPSPIKFFIGDTTMEFAGMADDQEHVLAIQQSVIRGLPEVFLTVLAHELGHLTFSIEGELNEYFADFVAAAALYGTGIKPFRIHKILAFVKGWWGARDPELVNRIYLHYPREKLSQVFILLQQKQRYRDELKREDVFSSFEEIYSDSFFRETYLKEVKPQPAQIIGGHLDTKNYCVLN